MRSYQKIQQPYKEEVETIWNGHVIIEEKVDGSQFRIEIDDKGQISCGSHHQELNLVDNNFKKGTEAAQELFKNYKAPNNCVTSIFCEYLSKPKQNAIPYARVPRNNLVIFDVIENSVYLNRKEKERFAEMMNMEVVPLLWEGAGESFTETTRAELLKMPSFLGHQAGYDRVEGIVVKNYGLWYDVNKYPYLEGMWLCTKIVNDSFKEKNKVENPSAGNALIALKESVRTEARWKKAVQHLKEKGELKLDMTDMVKLAPRVVDDLREEEEETIKKELWKLYGKSILQYSVRGLPEWYRKQLEEKTLE